MEKIGKYQILEELGKGAMGVVYKALDPDINREVAIKTIRFEAVTDGVEKEELMKRFMKEAQAAGKLTHPNIITIYDVGREKDSTYIVMQYIEGESIKDVIESGKQFTPHKIIDLMVNLCDALDYAHPKGIVHRDMKPGNILVNKEGKPFIVDFGVARVETSTMTQTGQTLGTPSYMSPEQVMGQKVDGRSDIFSLGVILYELLTGQRPFSSEGGITTLIYKIINEAPLPITKVKKNVSPKFEPIIEKALAKDPNERYQNCSELAADLRPLKEVPEKTLTLKLSREELLSEKKKKKPKLALILALSLSAIIIIGGGGYWLLTQKAGKTSPSSEKIQEAKLDESQLASQVKGVVTDQKQEKPADVKNALTKEVKLGEPPVKTKKEAAVIKPKEEKPKEAIKPPKETKEVKKEEPPSIKTVVLDPLEGLRKRVKDSFMMENYEETKRLAKEILSKNPNDKTGLDYLNRAERKILTAQKLEEGIRSYDSGDYEKCLQIMGEILKLEQGNKQAQQYLKLANNAMTSVYEREIRQIIERQRRAEEEEDIPLLFSDYSQALKNKRREDIIDLFNFYDDIKSEISNLSINLRSPAYPAEVKFYHILIGVSKSTGKKTIIFENWRTLTLERQGKTWKIIDYK